MMMQEEELVVEGEVLIPMEGVWKGSERGL